MAFWNALVFSLVLTVDGTSQTAASCPEKDQDSQALLQTAVKGGTKQGFPGGQDLVTASEADGSRKFGFNKCGRVKQAEDRRLRQVTTKMSMEDHLYLQEAHCTTFDRYPTMFTLLKGLLGKVGREGKPLKLLSFGCSDGRECHSLRMYFPDAVIHGVDISKDIIAEAIANNTDPLIQFYTDTAALSTESYDAVLANGVLTTEYGDQTKSSKSFVEGVSILDRLMRKDGYLLMYNAGHLLSEYPRYHAFQNMCGGGSSEGVVKSVDVMYETDSDTRGDSTRGQCSTQDKFCIESGWLAKYDAAGQEIQKFVSDHSGYGCQHPGPIFKKLAAIEK